jgi:sigma-B regulation protein RsbU (phosphoserine phosphatase)
LQTQISANDVLSVFRSNELRLFVAAASITVGLVAVGFSLIRQRFDRLLSFLAWLAEYGFRLWLQSDIFRLMAHPSVAFNKLQMALNVFVAIPAFLFFEASGLIGRAGRVIVYVACLMELCLIAAVLLGAPLPWIDKANSILVIAGTASAMLLAFRQPAVNQDAVVFRAGLTVFVVLVVCTNVVELLGRRATFEFYGFAVLLCCLGYVAAHRALDRDRQLSSIQQELEIARRIQLSILPAASPRLQHFSVATRYKPMTSVAGDFYEVLNSGTGAIGLLVADVSGHGVPAALIASMVKVAIQAQRHRQDDPAALLAGVNEALCGNAQNQFVTAGYVFLDPTRDQLCYAGAGHPPMFVLRSGSVSRIEENGLVLALMPTVAYSSTTQSLLRGDRILLYTDGVIEAAAANGEEFGYDRLSHLLEESSGSTAEQAADLILGAVGAWSPSQSDDLTIIVCDYKPQSA